MIATELADRAVEWFKNRNDVEEVGEAAGKAADAIDSTVEESEHGMEQIVAQLVEIITTLTNVLAGIDPSKNPQDFGDCVKTGADLIEQAGDLLHGICQDRDEAINQCFSALTDHGEQVCKAEQKPLCGAASEGTSGGVSSSAASASSGSSGSSSVASTSDGAVDKTVPATAEPIEEKPDEDNCENKPEKSETEECPPEKVATDSSECKDSQEKTPEDLLKGGIGVGMVALGVELLVGFLEQACADISSEECPPEPITEQPPGPTPEPEPEPEPEPTPEPEAVKPPEAELHLVPEPAPKPIPQGINNEAQAAAVNYAPPVPDPPTQLTAVPEPELEPAQPEPVIHDSPAVNVHKAGGW